MERTVCLIQSRYRSSRLPGKATLDLMGYPLLWHVVWRCQQASTLDRVVVATGDAYANEPILDLCRHYGWDSFAGSEDDVLARFNAAAQHYKADVVVRVSGDSPLICPEQIDRVVRARAAKGYRYASNAHPPTYPDGLDCEAVTAMTLAHVHAVATLQSDREHCTAWLSRNLPPHQWVNVTNYVDQSGYRLCVDTPADLTAMRQIMRIAGALCTWDQAVRVLEDHPEIRRLTDSITRNQGYHEQVAKEQAAVPAST